MIGLVLPVFGNWGLERAASLSRTLVPLPVGVCQCRIEQLAAHSCQPSWEKATPGVWSKLESQLCYGLQSRRGQPMVSWPLISNLSLRDQTPEFYAWFNQLICTRCSLSSNFSFLNFTTVLSILCACGWNELQKAACSLVPGTVWAL